MKTPFFNSCVEQAFTYMTTVSIVIYTLAMGYGLTQFTV
jgi:hypothetical protein